MNKSVDYNSIAFLDKQARENNVISFLSGRINSVSFSPVPSLIPSRYFNLIFNVLPFPKVPIHSHLNKQNPLKFPEIRLAPF